LGEHLQLAAVRLDRRVHRERRRRAGDPQAGRVVGPRRGARDDVAAGRAVRCGGRKTTDDVGERHYSPPSLAFGTSQVIAPSKRPVSTSGLLEPFLAMVAGASGGGISDCAIVFFTCAAPHAPSLPSSSASGLPFMIAGPTFASILRTASASRT